MFNNNNFKYFVDSKEKLDFNEVLEHEAILFNDSNASNNHRFDLNTQHWFVIKIKKNDLCKSHLIFELFDFKYQKGEIFFPISGSNKYKNYKFGYLEDFDMKHYQHKNFVWSLDIKDTTTHKIFIKVKSNMRANISGVVRNDINFIAWALNEYFYLALFYGILISLFLYNLFIYLNMGDRTYLYYTLYIAFAGLWCLSNDGLGFQYVWSNMPILNKIMYPLSDLFMITFLALYTKAFFDLRNQLPKLANTLIIVLILRSIPFFAWILNFTELNPYIDFYIFIDLSVLIFLAYIGLTKSNKQRHSKLYFGAFSLLILGYIIFLLNYYNIIYATLAGLYAIYIGIACNMIALAMGLVSRLKHLTKETERKSNQLLANLMEKELLKDELNRQLELKVTQRTHELQEKNEELNSFVYRASHDIKGPISSLMGLAQIGLLENNPNKLKEYFNHVLTSSEKLDKTLSGLLQLSHVNETAVRHDEVNIKSIINELLNQCKFQKKCDDINIVVSDAPDENVNIDQRLLKPILQNLIENSVKYADLDKPEPFVNIQIKHENDQLTIVVSDNGQGIPKEYQLKVFEKFFRLGLKGDGSGLGLHIVQKCVEKLNGTVELSSIHREGTIVIVRIPILERFQAD